MRTRAANIIRTMPAMFAVRGSHALRRQQQPMVIANVTMRHLCNLQRNHDFDVTSALTHLSKEFEKELNIPPNSNFLARLSMAAVQHLLGTTHNMMQVAIKNGLGGPQDGKITLPLVMTGKSYSTHADTEKAIGKLNVTMIPPELQLGYGGYNDANELTISLVWRTYDNHLRAYFFKQARLYLFKGKNYNDPELIDNFKRLAPEEQDAFRNEYMPYLLALDDGAQLLAKVLGSYFNGCPWKPSGVVGVEQTRGGTNRGGIITNNIYSAERVNFGLGFRGLPFDIFVAAGAYVKQLERKGVANALADRIKIVFEELVNEQKGKKNEIKVGVVGCGDQGKAIVEKLANDGYEVRVYDSNREVLQNVARNQNGKVSVSPTISGLIGWAKIIISVTGHDITANYDTMESILSYAPVLISGSSEDREFCNLLRFIQTRQNYNGVTPEVLETINFKTEEGKTLTIFRGGFPANFDNSKHSVSPREIWPTRALLLATMYLVVARMQALSSQGLQGKHHAKILMVCPHMQLRMLKLWAQYNPHDEFLNEINQKVPDWQLPKGQEAAVEFIKERSEGDYWDYKGLLKNNPSLFRSQTDEYPKLIESQLSPSFIQNNCCGIG